MTKIFKKTYKFAAYTSGYITLFLAAFFTLFLVFINDFNIWILLLFTVLIYVFSFFVIQYRVEKFIYKRVKKIYDDVSILDASSLSEQPITTNMETLTKQVERFAQHKKLEIEALKIRENYRKEFIGNISHELKTPLFTVQGYILTLLDGGALKDKKVREKYLERANKGVERLIYIVKDLDMITKLEVGDLNLNKEDFDIIELINNVFELFEMKASKKIISLTFDKDYKFPVLVHADKERVQQVVSNLIVNSIKYGQQDGTTEVRVEMLANNKVLIRITDNGVGIEKKYIPRLFERFFRVDKSGSRQEGGSGLGLSIVKHIVEAHSERIYVESQYGIGSEFSFTLEQAK
ncbi:MAG: sensor histidine kinase [Flavobacteriaceae bacterium]|nr:sensor histidine kinase [Flavobacteriaceae bacterium]